MFKAFKNGVVIGIIIMYTLLAIAKESGILDSSSKHVIINTTIASSNEDTVPNPCELEVVICEYETKTSLQKQSKSSKEEIEQIIREIFKENADVAIAIAKAESGLNPLAVGKINKNGTRDYGLFQINDIHNPTKNIKEDARANTLEAKRLYDERGNFTAWSAYNNKSYLKFIK